MGLQQNADLHMKHFASTTTYHAKKTHLHSEDVSQFDYSFTPPIWQCSKGCQDVGDVSENNNIAHTFHLSVELTS